MRVINKKETYIYGEYQEINIFPVYSGNHKKVREEKAKTTKKSQKELNKRNRKKKYFRLLHENFKNRDYIVTLTYAPHFLPSNEEEAKEDYRKLMRSLRKEYSKKGIEMKYMAWIEKGIEKGRLHHHFVITGGVDIEIFENLFKKGFVNVRKLKKGFDDLLGLAEYFSKDPKGKRSFTCSKNLSRKCLIPAKTELNKTSKYEIKKIIENYEDKEFFEKMFPGYELVTGEVRNNEYSRHAYVYLIMRKKGIYSF